MLTRPPLLVLHILHHRLLFVRWTYSLFLSFPLSLVLSYSLPLSFFLPLAPSISTHLVFLSRAFLNPRKHTPIQIVTLSLSHRSPPSHSSAFPHPCGTSRKLYVPTLATLNAGLARDNPRPSPPPSTTADPPRPPVVLPISAARRLPLFSPRRRSSRIHNQLTNTQVA